MNRVFLFAGQSDMRGNSDAAGLDLNNSIHLVYSNDVHKHTQHSYCTDWIPLQGQSLHKGYLTIGPEAGFDLYKLSNGTINDNVYIIKYAMENSCLEKEWIEYFETFIDFVLSALAKVPDPKQLCALCWLDGVRDSSSVNTDYYNNLAHFVKTVRVRLNQQNLLFMYAENILSGENIDVVNKASFDSVNGLGSSCFVTNEGLDFVCCDDGMHLSLESLTLIGRKLACKYIDIVNDASKIRLRCKNFFDGENLYGPTLLTFDESGVLLSISSNITDDCFDYDLITPGFIDLQVNGYAQYDVDASKEDLIQLTKTLYHRGTTSFLATLVTGPLSELLDKVTILSNDLILGFHLEGPFIGKAPGDPINLRQ